MYENMFARLASLIKVGKLKAIETMIKLGIDKKLLVLVDNGFEMSQHHTITTLKTLTGCLDPFILKELEFTQ
jgi:hypothetical protein